MDKLALLGITCGIIFLVKLPFDIFVYYQNYKLVKLHYKMGKDRAEHWRLILDSELTDVFGASEGDEENE